MKIKDFFNNFFKILSKKSLWGKIEFIGALIFIIIMFSISASAIGWWTVFTSFAIGIMYDDIKSFIIEVCNKNFDDEKEKK